MRVKGHLLGVGPARVNEASRPMATKENKTKGQVTRGQFAEQPMMSVGRIDRTGRKELSEEAQAPGVRRLLLKVKNRLKVGSTYNFYDSIFYFLKS